MTASEEAPRLVFCTNSRCLMSFEVSILDNEVGPSYCSQCGSACIELCPNCGVRVVDVLKEMEQATWMGLCPRCQEPLTYDVYSGEIEP